MGVSPRPTPRRATPTPASGRAYALDALDDGLGASNEELGGTPIGVLHDKANAPGIAFSWVLADETLTSTVKDWRIARLRPVGDSFSLPPHCLNGIRCLSDKSIISSAREGQEAWHRRVVV